MKDLSECIRQALSRCESRALDDKEDLEAVVKVVTKDVQAFYVKSLFTSDQLKGVLNDVRDEEDEEG